MARIAGVDLPKNKRGEIGLTYIYGIGPSTARYILEKAGVDCVMFWSFQYKHAMLGVNINSRGNYKLHNGRNYYFVETTYPGWEIGDIDPEMDDLSMWYVDDLDSDIMKIDFKYNIIDDEKTNDVNRNKRKNLENNDGKDSGKRDRPSPSNK